MSAPEVAGYENGVTTSLSALEANCQEEACARAGPAIPVSVTVDANGWYDNFNVQCAGDGSFRSLASNATGCWDCRGNCATAPVCPAGAECVTIPGMPGSDCRAYMCPADWTMRAATAGFQVPVCEHAVPSGPPAAPVTTASTVTGKPRITWSAVSGAASYRIYRQIEWMSAPDSWNEVTTTSYYDGSTRVSGAPQPWPPYGKWVSYQVVSVSASGVEGGRSSVNYYPYTAIIPY